MGWANWMVVNQSLEEELELERTVRSIHHIEDIETLQKLCSSLTRQSWHQTKILKQAVSHIAELDLVGLSDETQ